MIQAKMAKQSELNQPVRVDIPRMQASLDSKSIQVPSGLTLEQKIKFIKEHQ